MLSKRNPATSAHLRYFLWTSLTLSICSHSAEARPNFAIGAEVHDKAMLSKAIRFYVDQLKMDSNTYLVVRYSMNLPSEVDAVMQYKSLGHLGHQVLITINRKNSPMNRLLALAHELVHAQQYIAGELQDVDNSTLRWKGTEFTNVEQTPYTARPWEYEALKASRQLRKAYLKQKKNQQAVFAVMD